MAVVQVKELNQVHEAIMAEILARPQATLAELAAKFGYTQSWISVIVRSDAFRARIKAENAEVMSVLTGDIKDKLITLVDVGVEKLSKHMEKTEDPEFIRDTVDKVLGRLGYGTGGGGRGVVVAAQQNNYFISKDELAEARGNILAPVVSSQPPLLDAPE